MKELPTLTLHAESLFSKWGFHDGDLITDWLEGLEEAGVDIEPYWDTDKHRVLRYLVRTYLLPLIPGEFTSYDISTIHNPIRIDTWRGGEWDDYTINAPAEVADIYVEVPGSAVLDALFRELGDELELEVK